MIPKHYTMIIPVLFLSSALTLAVPAYSSAAASNLVLSVDADVSILNETAKISPYLYGLFLEDINFTIDGGMYAQMVKNGSFEYGLLAKNSHEHGSSCVSLAAAQSKELLIKISTAGKILLGTVKNLSSMAKKLPEMCLFARSL